MRQVFPSSHSAMAIVLMASTMLSSVSVHAQSVPDDRLLPRAEVSVKGGSERSNLTTEFWAPLAQKSGQVLYTDLRLMGDDDDNREGNLGFGYRRIVESTDSILGGNLWIDRRRTAANNTFHQVTVGVESLGKVIDLRANGYVPLNGGGDTVTTPNIGSTTPYLAGNGLFYDTNGSVTETPQYGVDAEVGYRVPVFQRYADTIRVYGGGYSFFRSNTEATTGYRVRTEAVINPVLSLGARFQHDAPRGDQGFLEATLRFPFSAKKLYQQKGLYGRLDESPERDIDIVTAKKVDTGLRKEITNSTTGEAQRIIYVDNSNTTATSDGTIEHPFSTLTAAQAALKANDILYIKAGTGTTTGMDQGITISQNNVSLIGSGSALTYQGFTFLNAGSAPILTNNQTYVEDLANNIHTGNGVYIFGDNAFVTGITVNGAQGHGIYALANGNALNNVTVNNTTTTNNINGGGVFVAARNGGRINNIGLANNTANYNGNSVAGDAGGIFVLAQDTNSYIDNALITNSSTSFNRNDGIRAGGRTGGTINNVSILNSIANNNNPGNGIDVHVDGGTVNTATITDANVAGNFYSGVSSYIRNGGVLGTINLQSLNATTSMNGSGVLVSADTGNGRVGTINANNLTGTSNVQQGVRFTATGTGSQINQINATNLTANTNSGQGVLMSAGTGGAINIIDLSSVTTSGSTSNIGLQIVAQNAGTIGVSTITGINSFGNFSYGVAVQAIGTGATIGNTILSNINSSNNRSTGIFINGTTNGVINNVNINNSITTNNTNRGIQAYIATSASIGTLTLANNSVNLNANRGIDVQNDTLAQFGSILITGNSLNANTSNNLTVYINGGNTVDAVTITGNTSTNATTSSGQGLGFIVNGIGSRVTTSVFSNNTATGNASRGLYTGTSNSGQMGNLTVNNNIVNNNGLNGITITANSSGVISTFTANGNTTNNNVAIGLYADANGGGTIGSGTITNNISNNNTGASGEGIRLDSYNTGASANFIVSGNTLTGNAEAGLFAFNSVTSSLSASLFNNNITGSGTNGLYLSKSGTGTFAVDAGGGSLSSVGGNRVFGNTGTEVRVDGGYAFTARTNYWGGTDLIAGEKTLNGGSTVDSTGFLTVDPRP